MSVQPLPIAGDQCCLSSPNVEANPVSRLLSGGKEGTDKVNL